MKKIIVLYVPVLHQGYIDFFQRHKDAETMFIVGEGLVKEFTSLHKEIRQIDPNLIAVVAKFIFEFWGYLKNVLVLEKGFLKYLKENEYSIITANDSVSLGVVEKYFPNHKREIDTAFLRWDENNVNSQKPAGYDEISQRIFDRKIMKVIEIESKKSSDWWRHTGAAIVKNKKIILISHNRHLPSEHAPYVFGDPRDFIKAGESPDIRTSFHAEHGLVVEAARRGIKLNGLNIYTIIFPCPICAKSIAYAGIKNLFFKTGWASLDGLDVLKARKVKIILVK